MVDLSIAMLVYQRVTLISLDLIMDYHWIFSWITRGNYIHTRITIGISLIVIIDYLIISFKKKTTLSVIVNDSDYGSWITYLRE